MYPRATAACVLLGCLLMQACDLLGLPRVAVAATSPDGGAVAFVLNHPTIDGPSQSLWLGPADGPSRKLRQLGEDQDWCHRIVWSADGSTVSYLIQDARLLTVDRRSGQVVSDRWLVGWRGEYPPYRTATNLELSADGRRARFRDCPRAGGRGFRPGACHDRELPLR